MHTRLETLDRPIERVARFYVERAKGGAALIITGGFSPNAEGLMEPGAPLFDSRGAAGRAPSHHRCGARGGRQDRAADPACGALRQDRRRRRAIDHRLADQPERAAAHDRGRHPAHHRGLRDDGGARPRGRLRRRRDHGHRRVISSTSSRRRAPTTAPTTGAAAWRTACGSPWRSWAPCARGSARTSWSSSASPRSTWSRAA